VPQATTVAAFLDDRTGLTTGCTLVLFRSMDGAASWSPRVLRHLCRYGLEIVPGLAVDTGNGGYHATAEVALSIDGGATWAPGSPFGGPVPHHVRHLSFLDARRGLVATDVELGLTTDGARSWQRLAPPATVEKVAAVSLADDGGRLVLRVLDESGALWRSDDRGRSWAAAPTPLPGRVLESTKGPTAALRFVGAEGVLAVSLDDSQGMAGRIYRTRDGGIGWSEERLETPFHAAVLTLSADGTILSALDAVGATVKVYRAR
jgi:photosystem II stability/assembly factor-like uncharacterized protein